MYHIGKEQLLVFLVTIFFTLFEDLLVGVAAGIITELFIHIFNGASLKHLFKARHEINDNDQTIHIKVNEAATFSNLIGFRNSLDRLPRESKVEIDFSKTKLIDHSFMTFITKYKNDFDHHGGNMIISGLDAHRPFSKHELAARKRKISV
jgi:MFS superfamily sulfate permease-like transporter